MKKKIFRWTKVIVLLYAIIGIAFYYLQDSILFHPEPLAKGSFYHFDQRYTEVNIPYDQKTLLNIVQFKPTDSARGVVLYFHGNRKNIGWYEKYAANFTRHGYETWMLDYPGFGKSTGTFSEQALYDYALQVYRLARKKYDPDRIILYGKSFGTCLACQLASVRDCRCLVLESPCYSMTSLIAHYLPFYPVWQMSHYRFPNNEYLQRVTAPVIVFHGTDDGVVPYSNAKRLKPILQKPGDEFVTVEGGSHNNLNDYPLYQQKLDSLLK
jgi:alpha-beta hydrolase superfamily lysophospholipase